MDRGLKGGLVIFFIVIIVLFMIIIGKSIFCQPSILDNILRINQLFHGEEVEIASQEGLISILRGEVSGIFFAFRPQVQKQYNYSFKISLDDKYKKVPYNLREQDIENWFTTPLSGSRIVDINGKYLTLHIKPPKNAPYIDFRLRLSVNNEDRADVTIKIRSKTLKELIITYIC